ncbi:MAG: DUF177 domain-containing protein [SAR202 cluster bacterium]|nr:DUF177 domain-containing protein [SAR202 cluster bacterium]
MQFNVSQLLREPSGATRTHEIHENLAPLDSGEALRVRGSVRMLKTGEGVWVGVALDSEVSCDCSRCLTGLRLPVHVEFEEEYFPIALGRTEERGLDPVDESQYINYDQVLDLDPAARQYLALAVPMKPMCKEDCAGICQTCGANLNNGPCACPRDTRDVRWGPLLELVAPKNLKDLPEN